MCVCVRACVYVCVCVRERDRLLLLLAVVVMVVVVVVVVIPCSSLVLPPIDEVSWLDFSQRRGPVTPRVTSYEPKCLQVHQLLRHDQLD